MISILKGIRNLTDSPAVNLKKYKGGKFLKRANARNVSFELLHGGQFTLSTQLIKPNYLIKYRAKRLSPETFQYVDKIKKYNFYNTW